MWQDLMWSILSIHSLNLCVKFKLCSQPEQTSGNSLPHMHHSKLSTAQSLDNSTSFSKSCCHNSWHKFPSMNALPFNYIYYYVWMPKQITCGIPCSKLQLWNNFQVFIIFTLTIKMFIFLYTLTIGQKILFPIKQSNRKTA